MNALRVFECAARHHNFSAAAKELCVTHGAVSQQIRHLEEWFGFPLFERHATGVRLTSAGRSLQQSARDAFDMLESRCDELRRHAEPKTVILGAPASFLSNWLIPRLERFEASHPDIQVTLQTASDPALLTSQKVDALILSERILPTGIVAVPLFAETIGPVCAPEWAGRLLQPSDISSLPLLHTTSRPTAWRDWAAACGLDGSRLLRERQFDHLGPLVEAAASGLGLAIAPRMLVERDIALGRLVAPLGFVESGAFFGLCRRKAESDAAIDAIQQWLLRECTTPASASAGSPVEA
jgi:DNA-binding transcriptional LysR family regulator